MGCGKRANICAIGVPEGMKSKQKQYLGDICRVFQNQQKLSSQKFKELC